MNTLTSMMSQDWRARDMKCLSIRAPWLHAIVHLGKRIENRRRVDGRVPSICLHRGPLLLHASQSCTADQYDAAVQWMEAHCGIRRSQIPPLNEHPRGVILALAEGIGHIDASRGLPPTSPRDQLDARWLEAGCHGLVFAPKVIALPPIPFKGALGLFDVDSAWVLDAISKAVRSV